LNQAALLHFFMRLSAMLPLWANRQLGHMVGWLLSILPGRGRHIVQRNLAACYQELSRAERKQLERATLIELGKSITEMGPMWCWPEQRLLDLITEVDNAEAYEAALARGKGVIVLVPHLGAWEIISPYVTRQHPFTALYRPPRLAAMEKKMVASRTRFGATFLPTGASGVRGILTALKRGEAVGILPDQDPGKKGEGEFAPFFGVSAYTMTLVPRLANRTGATVLLTYCVRLPGSRGYRLVFSETDAAIAADDMQVATSAMNQEVERAARAAPAQYQWAYKRFKTRPPGEPRIY
jgi:KDO2-lipid IV(A) lauroyltransferase